MNMYLFGVLEYGEEAVDLRHITLSQLKLVLHLLLLLQQVIYYVLEKHNGEINLFILQFH